MVCSVGLESFVIVGKSTCVDACQHVWGNSRLITQLLTGVQTGEATMKLVNLRPPPRVGRRWVS